jgi:hypothetical protein
MIHHEVRRVGKHSFLDLYASSTVLGFINRLAEKCGVYGGEFIIDRKGLTVGRTYFKFKSTRYGGLLNVAPMGFLKLVEGKRFNTRLAGFQSQFPSLRYEGILSKYTKVDFKVRSQGDAEYLDIYAHPQVIAYVDNVAKSDDVSQGDYLKDSQGSITGRSYYTLSRHKCVKWSNPFDDNDENETWDRGECLEYETRVYAPKKFARKMKSVLVPANIMKLPKIKGEIKELKKVKDSEGKRSNSILICVQDLDALVERNNDINPQSLRPKDYNIAWVSVGRLLGAAHRLKEDLLAEVKRPLPPFALEGTKLYESFKGIPWLGKKLKMLKGVNLFPTLAFELDSVIRSLEKKRNFLTSMLYLTEADKALFDVVRDKRLSKEDRDRKVVKIQNDLKKNLKHFFQRDPKKSFGLTMSRVLFQKYDILREKYFTEGR